LTKMFTAFPLWAVLDRMRKVNAKCQPEEICHQLILVSAGAGRAGGPVHVSVFSSQPCIIPAPHDPLPQHTDPTRVLLPQLRKPDGSESDFRPLADFRTQEEIYSFLAAGWINLASDHMDISR
jgi:hypothetical protein